jgi:hypothetical protein
MHPTCMEMVRDSGMCGAAEIVAGIAILLQIFSKRIEGFISPLQLKGVGHRIRGGGEVTEYLFEVSCKLLKQHSPA